MPSSRPPSSEAIVSARRLVVISATLMLVGIGITVIHTGLESLDEAIPIIGQVLAAASFIGLVWGLHRFGRLGAEPARDGDDGPGSAPNSESASGSAS